MAEYFKRVKEMTDQEAGVSFREKILSMWEFKKYIIMTWFMVT